MGCGSSTEPAVEDVAIKDHAAPSHWVLRRRQRLQQQQQQRGGADGFDFSGLPAGDDQDPTRGVKGSTHLQGSRDSAFMRGLTSGDPTANFVAAPVSPTEAARRLSPGNPLEPHDGAVDLAMPVASNVLVGDLVRATTPRQSPTLPRPARVLRFSPAPSSCSEKRSHDHSFPNSLQSSRAAESALDDSGDALAASM